MDLRKEIRLGRTEMSTRELGRVEVVARIRSKQLRMVDASQLMGGELSTGEAVVEALSGRRSGRSEAPQRKRALEPRRNTAYRQKSSRNYYLSARRAKPEEPRAPMYRLSLAVTFAEPFVDTSLLGQKGYAGDSDYVAVARIIRSRPFEFTCAVSGGGRTTKPGSRMGSATTPV
jgi:hypothetical protein